MYTKIFIIRDFSEWRALSHSTHIIIPFINSQRKQHYMRIHNWTRCMIIIGVYGLLVWHTWELLLPWMRTRAISFPSTWSTSFDVTRAVTNSWRHPFPWVSYFLLHEDYIRTFHQTRAQQFSYFVNITPGKDIILDVSLFGNHATYCMPIK